MGLTTPPLLTQIAHQQVGYVQKDAPITNIPADVLRLIFDQLTPDAFASLIRSCKRFWTLTKTSDGTNLKMKLLAQMSPLLHQVGGVNRGGFHPSCLYGEMLYVARTHGSLNALNLRTRQTAVLMDETWGGIAISANKLLTGTFDDRGSKLPLVMTQLNLQTKGLTHHILPETLRCSQDSKLVFDRALGLMAVCHSETIDVVSSDGEHLQSLSVEENTSPDGTRLLMIPANQNKPARLISTFFRSKEIAAEPGYIYGFGIKLFTLSQDTQEATRMFWGEEFNCFAASPSNAAIASCSRNNRGPRFARIHLLDPATLQTVRTISQEVEYGEEVKSLHFGATFLIANIANLLATSANSILVICDLSKEQEEEPPTIEIEGTSTAIHVQDHLLAFVQKEGESHFIELRNLLENQPIGKFILPNDAKKIEEISFKYGENLIAIDADGQVYVWHIKNMAPVVKLTVTNNKVQKIT